MPRYGFQEVLDRAAEMEDDLVFSEKDISEDEITKKVSAFWRSLHRESKLDLHYAIGGKIETLPARIASKIIRRRAKWQAEVAALLASTEKGGEGR